MNNLRLRLESVQEPALTQILTFKCVFVRHFQQWSWIFASPLDLLAN